MNKEFVDAAQDGDEAKVRRLLAGGADPSAADGGWPALVFIFKKYGLHSPRCEVLANTSAGISMKLQA